MADTEDSDENQQAPGTDADGRLEPEAMADDPSMIGRVLGGKYVILEKLGQGGMGVVYKAEQTYVDRIVAVKILHSHLTANKTFLKRFHSEARINSRISHPNAVTLYDFGIEDGMPYLVLEFVQGTTLKDTLSREGALPINRINNILKQVGGALVAAHELDIVHRDLKPDNIMLTKGPTGEEEIRVLDFGIAKALHQTGEQGNTMVTQAGMLMGTPAYISPELAMERELDARSDIYSLGVILFEMLTGEVPFKSSSPLETYIQHIRNEPPQVRELKPELNIPKTVSYVVAKALEKDPANRFQFVGEMIRAFDYAARTRDAAPSPQKPLPALEPTLHKDPLPQAPKRPMNKALLGSIGLTVAAVAALFIIPQFLDHHAPEKGSDAADSNTEAAPAEEAAKTDSVQTDSAAEQTAAAGETAVAAPDSADPQTAHEPTARALAPNDTIDLNADAPVSNKPITPTEEQTAQIAPAEQSAEPVAPSEQASIETPLSETTEPELHTGTAEIAPQTPAAATNAPPNEPSVTAETKAAAEEIDLTKNDTPSAVEPNLEQPSAPEAAQTEAAPDGGVDEVTATLLAPEPAPAKPLSPQKAKAEADRLTAEGDKLLDKKDYMAAGLVLKKALALQENNLGARLSFGSALLRLGKTDAAIGQFEKAVAIDSQYAPAHYSLASAYALNSNTEKAIESLTTAAKLFPGVSKWLADDADFASLKDDPRYQAIATGKK